MLSIAAIGVALGLSIAEKRRRERLALLEMQYQRQIERSQWAENMEKLGYITKEQLEAEHAERARIQEQLND